jgi:SAM-dependent methyltransferase
MTRNRHLIELTNEYSTEKTIDPINYNKDFNELANKVINKELSLKAVFDSIPNNEHNFQNFINILVVKFSNRKYSKKVISIISNFFYGSSNIAKSYEEKRTNGLDYDLPEVSLYDKNILKDHLLKLDRENIKTVVDIGTGVGHDLKMIGKDLKIPEKNLIGFDPDQNAIEKAKRILPKALLLSQTGDEFLKNLPELSDNLLFTSFSTIHFLPEKDRKEFLKKLGNLIKKTNGAIHIVLKAEFGKKYNDDEPLFLIQDNETSQTALCRDGIPRKIYSSKEKVTVEFLTETGLTTAVSATKTTNYDHGTPRSVHYVTMSN